MNSKIDETNEIGVFDAARYFASYDVHGLSYNPINTLDGFCANSKSIELHKMESNFIDLQYSNKKEIKKIKQPSSPSVRLVNLLNSLFHQSSSKKIKPKSPKNMADTPKSYPFSPQRQGLKDQLEVEFNHGLNELGFVGEIWRDRRLEGISVVRGDVGKRWVLNNASGEGLFGKDLFWEEGICEKEKGFWRKENEEEEGDDLFELKNYKLQDPSSIKLPVYETNERELVGT